MKRLIVLVAVLCLGATTVAFGATATASKSDSGTAWVGATHSEGSDLYVAGDLKDKVLGRGSIVYVTTISAGSEPGSVLVKARKITVYTTAGALTGSGQATQNTAPDGTITVTDGTFNLTKGYGKLKGHKLKGTFSGTYADGVYTFKYTGTYK
jgi:hypothetical protein